MGHFENIRSEVHPEASMTSASPIGGSLVPIAVIRAPEGLCTVDRRGNTAGHPEFSNEFSRQPKLLKSLGSLSRCIDDRLGVGRGGRRRSACSASACMPPIRALYTEPHGSVSASPTRCLIRRAVGRDPARRAGATQPRRRFYHGPRRKVPYDPHGHEEACCRVGAGGACHY